MPGRLDLRHEVLEKGQADLSIVFTTDPQIKRNGVVLQDDKGMFPPYNSVFIIETTCPRRVDRIRRWWRSCRRASPPPVMQELNARADLDKKTPEQVASST